MLITAVQQTALVCLWDLFLIRVGQFWFRRFAGRSASFSPWPCTWSRQPSSYICINMWSPVSPKSIEDYNPQSVLWIAKCQVWKQGVCRSDPNTEHLKVRASNQDSIAQIYRFFIATWPASGHASSVRLWCSSFCQQLISSSQWGSECLVVILANHLLYPCVKQNGPGNWFPMNFGTSSFQLFFGHVRVTSKDTSQLS